MVVDGQQSGGGGKVTIFMWLFLLWLGFGFVHGGERETGGGGRKIEAIIFFWSYILVDNKYYFTVQNRKNKSWNTGCIVKWYCIIDKVAFCDGKIEQDRIPEYECSKSHIRQQNGKNWFKIGHWPRAVLLLKAIKNGVSEGDRES